MKTMIKNLFRIVLLLVTCWALYQQMAPNGIFMLGSLSYFTIQSNILVAAFILYLLLTKSPGKTARGVMSGTILVCITLTAIGYNFFLYNIFNDWGTVGYTFSRTVLHLITPVGFLLDWIFFQEHGTMHLRNMPLWLLYPLCYGTISLVASHITGTSLYFFLTFQNLNYLAMVAGILIGICVIFLLIDYVLYQLKRNSN